MLIYLLIGLLICALFAYQVADKKSAGSRGFWLGLFFGPAGVIAAGFMDGRPQCPHCGGKLNDTTDNKFNICPNCRSDLVAGQKPLPEERAATSHPSTAKQDAIGIASFSHLLHTE